MVARVTVAALLAGWLARSAAAAEPAAPVRPRLAVTGFVAPDLSEDTLAGLEEVATQTAGSFTRMDVVSATDVRALLSLTQLQQLTGCAQAECMTQFGSILAVQQMISGSVRKVGDRYTVNLVLHDLVNGRTLRRSSGESEARADALLPVVRQGVAVLFGVVGQIRIWDQPAGAEVFLDDSLVGPTPVDVVTVRSPGRHTVAVMGAGVTPWRHELDVTAGADLRLRAMNRSVVDLETAADERRGRGYVLGAGAGVAAVGAGVLWALAVRNDGRLDGLDRRTATQAELDAITERSFTLALTSGVFAALGAVLGGSAIYHVAVNPAAAELEAHRAAGHL